MGYGELINITEVKRVKCWKVYAVRGDKVASKSFSDLAEATEFRDAFISENPLLHLAIASLIYNMPSDQLAGPMYR